MRRATIDDAIERAFAEDRILRRWILSAGLLARRPFSFDPQRGIVTFGKAA